ncbi:MAG TPA: nuclear transport factor 2 family protein [Xanthomonadaceae bacterium]|nr:nuclear transport factor 2 family protein [Xanthomonadaceae bacterium]
MKLTIRTMVLLPLLAVATAAVGLEPGSASGQFTVNGQSVELRHAYAYREAKGFYNDSDPTWTLVFTAEPVAARDIDDHFLDPSVRIGLTLTSEFGDQPALQVLSQNLRSGSFSLSGGEDPVLALEHSGPDAFSGRIHHAEPRTFFEDTYQYDVTFHAAVSDPDAPIGDPLPADGGQPGAAYRAWTKAIHAGDIAALKQMVAPDMAAALDEPDAKESLEFMALMTPREVRIVSGSSDGETAVLHIEGTMDDQPVKGTVTLVRNGEHWIPTESSVQ